MEFLSELGWNSSQNLEKSLHGMRIKFHLKFGNNFGEGSPCNSKKVLPQFQDNFSRNSKKNPSGMRRKFLSNIPEIFSRQSKRSPLGIRRESLNMERISFEISRDFLLPLGKNYSRNPLVTRREMLLECGDNSSRNLERIPFKIPRRIPLNVLQQFL